MNLKDILIENLLNEFGKGNTYDYTLGAMGKNCEMFSIYKFVTDGKETDGTKYNFNVIVEYVKKSSFQEGSGIDVSFTTDEKKMKTLNVGLKELIKIMSTVSKIVVDHVKECYKEGIPFNYMKFFPVKGTTNLLLRVSTVTFSYPGYAHPFRGGTNTRSWLGSTRICSTLKDN